MKGYARLLIRVSAAAWISASAPAIASPHTVAECREGGEFIRHAARARDYGMPRERFMNQLEADLRAIQAFVPELRWFARDASDEQMLIEHAGRVFDLPLDPLQHENQFLTACMPQA